MFNKFIPILCIMMLIIPACVDGGGGNDAVDAGVDVTDMDASDMDASDMDASDMDASDVDATDVDDCVALTEGAQNQYQPADIIFVIDNSFRMEDEIAAVQDNMNSFSADIIARGIDVQIAMISCMSGDCGIGPGGTELYGICIEPPLGASDGCLGNPDDGPVSDDNNLPIYRHINVKVPSMKGLDWIIDTYAENNHLSAMGWQDMIRADSVKHFILVSDDADQTTAMDFQNALMALDPVVFADYKFHSIFSYMSKDDACAINSNEPCCTYAASEDDPELHWDTYSDLVSMTGGVSGDLCLQDFDPVFEALGTSVINSVELSCEWEIPAPPEGEEFHQNLVNVELIKDDGGSDFIGHVSSIDDCSSMEHGWYYDDPVTPTMIVVCPQTCEWIQEMEEINLVIHFGCETENSSID
jgi:hypothetical protein